MKNLIISEETAKKLAKPVKGCKHPRFYLTAILAEDSQQLYCIGCGTWFDVSGVEEITKKED